MTISSPVFLAFAVLMPLIKRRTSKAYSIFYSFVSVMFLYFACDELISFIICIAYPLAAYFLSLILKNKRAISAILVLAFIYLRMYPLITELLPQIYFFESDIFAISYIMFRTISWVYESKREGIIMVYAYVFSFYTILAGPVESFTDFCAAFNAAYKEIKFNDILNALLRIAYGYVKVIGIARIFYDLSYKYYPVFAVSAIANLLYVYFDFSGYCDVVISFARLAGIEVRENFNKPFCAVGVDDFWRRWNIGISTWLKNYVYYPLGGGRHGLLRKCFNTMIVFIVSGLWHGMNINSLVFGALQGLGVCICKVYEQILIKILGSKEAASQYRNKGLSRIVEIAFTFAFECFAFMFLTMEIL